jgi:hypothetical protein
MKTHFASKAPIAPRAGSWIPPGTGPKSESKAGLTCTFLTEIRRISSDWSREKARPPVAEAIGLVYAAIAHQSHNPGGVQLKPESLVQCRHKIISFLNLCGDVSHELFFGESILTDSS